MVLEYATVNLKQKSIGMVLLGIGLMVLGCDRGDPMTVTDASKTPAKQELPAGHPPINGGQMPAMQAAAPEGAAIRWEVPAGWKQVPGSGMRFATLQMSEEDPALALTVIPLAGQSGSLVANVNRWEGQLGLPSTPEAQLSKVVQRVEAGGVKIDVVDLTGVEQEGGRQRILGAIVPHEGRVWFFKTTGPAEKMGKQKEKFDQFIRSIRFGAAPATQPAR